MSLYLSASLAELRYDSLLFLLNKVEGHTYHEKRFRHSAGVPFLHGRFSRDEVRQDALADYLDQALYYVLYPQAVFLPELFGAVRYGGRERGACIERTDPSSK